MGTPWSDGSQYNLYTCTYIAMPPIAVAKVS